MLFAVRDFLILNLANIKDLPEFETKQSLLQNTILEIQRISELQKFDKTGLAREKQQLQDVLIMLTKGNSNKLTAFAKLKKDLVLLNEVKFSTSDLKRSPDSALKDLAQIIYDRAEASLDMLGGFGITRETQTVLLNAINSYNASLAKPRLGTMEKSQATKKLDILFKEGDKILGDIDAVINMLIIDNPNLLNGYKSARKVVVTGTNSFSLKGSAIESVTGIPLKGVTFTFASDNPMLAGKEIKPEVVKKTAEKGKFVIKSLPDGTYTVKVTKTGYKEKIVRVSVPAGELASLNVELEKI